MKEMQAMGRQNFMGNFPDMYNLVVNANHPVINKLNAESNPERKKEIAKQTVDLAMLSQNLLKGEELTKFIRRSYEMLS
jgi:molecular chaperone HtpG